MTNAQIAAFQAGAGVAPSAVLLAIASVTMVIATVWVMWVSLGSFRAWHEGQITSLDLIWSTLRASFVLLVLGMYLR